MTESPSDITVVGVELLTLTRIVGETGTLVVGQLGAGLPFIAKRVFALFDIPSGEARGTHAHKECEQLLICMRGNVTAIVDDGEHRQEIVLDDPSVALYMPALTWGTQYNYSADALLVVLASDQYDADDYIHDYEEFLSLRAKDGK
jgi:UDP-2-acetamido-3-amino-2,3-dideoxy-glucuronate N-acetyltransferase